MLFNRNVIGSSFFKKTYSLIFTYLFIYLFFVLQKIKDNYSDFFKDYFYLIFSEKKNKVIHKKMRITV